MSRKPLEPLARDVARWAAAVELDATLMVAKDAWLEGRPFADVLEGNGIADGAGESQAAQQCGIGRHDEIEWEWVFEGREGRRPSTR